MQTSFTPCGLSRPERCVLNLQLKKTPLLYAKEKAKNVP